MKNISKIQKFEEMFEGEFNKSAPFIVENTVPKKFKSNFHLIYI